MLWCQRAAAAFNGGLEANELRKRSAEGWVLGKRLRDYVLTPFDDPSTFVKKRILRWKS